jgi:hypothetical protein
VIGHEAQPRCTPCQAGRHPRVLDGRASTLEDYPVTTTFYAHATVRLGGVGEVPDLDLGDIGPALIAAGLSAYCGESPRGLDAAAFRSLLRAALPKARSPYTA